MLEKPLFINASNAVISQTDCTFNILNLYLCDTAEDIKKLLIHLIDHLVPIPDSIEFSDALNQYSNNQYSKVQWAHAINDRLNEYSNNHHVMRNFVLNQKCMMFSFCIILF